MEKELYIFPELEVLNLGLEDDVNTTSTDVISASQDVYEKDPFAL